MLKSRLTYNQVLVFVILLFFLFQTLISISVKSPIYDEPAHLARGYLYLKTGHLAIIGHPPLMHILAGFPLLFMNLALPSDYADYLIKNDYISISPEIFYHVNNNANGVFFWSRIPLILLGVISGFYVYKWAKELYGIKAGIFALLLYTFNPLILGNAPLLMTDMIFACFGFISLYYLQKFLSDKSIINLILTSIMFGFAMSSKFTVLFLIPIYCLLMIYSAYDFSIKKFFKETFEKSSIKNLKSLAGYSLIIIFIVIFIINLVYGFDGMFKTTSERIKSDPSAFFDKQYFMPDDMASRITTNPFFRGTLSMALDYGPTLLPYGYLKDLIGIIRVNNPALSGSTTGGFLMGEYSKEGWWYYYLFAFLIKTPIPLLILIIISLASIIYRKLEPKNEAFIILPLLVFFVFFSTHKSIGGLRYLLPSFPFLFVFISRIRRDNAIGTWLGKINTFNTILILLLILYVMESIFVFPNYTAYFNQFIGGASNGYKYLQGNDLDAGQDLRLLAKYVNKNEIKNLKLAYYGTPDPYYYLNFSCMACPQCPVWIIEKCRENCRTTTGTIAVSASLLQNTPHLNNRTCFDWLKSYEPIEKIGYTIFVYNISPT